MDTTAPERTTPLRCGKSSGVERSCVQSGGSARRTIVVAAEDSLRFRAGEPFDKRCCGVFVGRVLQRGGIEDQRLRLISFAIHSQGDLRMIGVDSLSAQIDFWLQSYEGQIERAGLNFVRRSRVEFTTLQSRLHRGLSEYLLRVDGGTKNFHSETGLLQEFLSQHQRKNNVAALRIGDGIGAPETQAGFLQDLPPRYGRPMLAIFYHSGRQRA